jgi:tryptophanyl-tRNA synthetase
VFSIETDSAKVADPKDPELSNLFAILKLFCSPETAAEWADRFRRGGLGYREVKQAIYDNFIALFSEARRKRRDLDSRPEYIEEVLRRGAEQARMVAAPLVRQVRDAVGIPNGKP